MADLSERELWARGKIEEKEAELMQVKKKLEAVQAELKEELRKPAEQNARLLDNLEADKANLSEETKSLRAELQGFQELLAAGGMCAFVSYAINCAPPKKIEFRRPHTSNNSGPTGGKRSAEDQGDLGQLAKRSRTGTPPRLNG